MHKNVLRLLPLVALIFLGFNCGLTQLEPPPRPVGVPPPDPNVTYEGNTIMDQVPDDYDPNGPGEVSYEGNTIMNQVPGVAVWGGPDEPESLAGKARASLRRLERGMGGWSPSRPEEIPLKEKLWLMSGDLTVDDIFDDYIDVFDPDELGDEPFEDLVFQSEFGPIRVHEYWYEPVPANKDCAGQHYQLSYGFAVTQKRQLLTMDDLPACGLGLVSDVETWSNFNHDLYLNYLVDRGSPPEGFEYVDPPELQVDFMTSQ